MDKATVPPGVTAKGVCPCIENCFSSFCSPAFWPFAPPMRRAASSSAPPPRRFWPPPHSPRPLKRQTFWSMSGWLRRTSAKAWPLSNISRVLLPPKCPFPANLRRCRRRPWRPAPTFSASWAPLPMKTVPTSAPTPPTALPGVPPTPRQTPLPLRPCPQQAGRS